MNFNLLSIGFSKEIFKLVLIRPKFKKYVKLLVLNFNLVYDENQLSMSLTKIVKVDKFGMYFIDADNHIEATSDTLNMFSTVSKAAAYGLLIWLDTN